MRSARSMVSLDSLVRDFKRASDSCVLTTFGHAALKWFGPNSLEESEPYEGGRTLDDIVDK